MTWTQHYDPFHSAWLSTAVAALPIVVLLGTIALLRLKIHFSALLALAVALAVAIGAYRMPSASAFAAAGYGAAYGLFPIGWIVLNLIFLYQLTVEKGWFAIIKSNLATLAPDARVQVILIAFSFGAFFEGAAGFGTPVAVTAAMMIQLGFKPLAASGLSLIANTAPVAYGALGTPIIALSGVTGLPLESLSAMAGRQLPFFSVLVPFWVVCAFAGFRRMWEVWPAALTAGVAFAIPQFLVSNYHGPWLVDIVASLCSLAAVSVLLKYWQPKSIWKLNERAGPREGGRMPAGLSAKDKVRAWVPWLLLSVLVFLWGIPKIKTTLNSWSLFEYPVAYLHQIVVRGLEVAPAGSLPEKAIFTLNWLSATGTGIFVAALASGFFMKFPLPAILQIYGRTFLRVRYSLITIAAMLALGYVTKYSGTDATLGLALAKTGAWYPFFGTLLGWLGVALTGSDTASNVLFGGLQKITAEKTGISAILMAAANSSGGVMGKMVDAQSIVVASTATNWYGHEGEILRYVFFHSLALAALVGILVYLQAYVPPWTYMVVP